MSRIPDALWPEILPVMRAPQLQSFRTSSARGTLLWIGADEIVLARCRGTLRIPDAAFRAGGSQVLESMIPRRRLRRFQDPGDRLAGSDTAAHRRRHAALRLTVRAGGQRLRRSVDVAVVSVPIEALARLLGPKMTVTRMRTTFGFWVLAAFIWAISGTLGVLAAKLDWKGDEWWAWLPSGFLISLLLGIWTALVVRGVRTVKPRPARAPRPIQIKRVPLRSPGLGLVLRLAGVALVAAAYLGASALAGRAAGPAEFNPDAGVAENLFEAAFLRGLPFMEVNGLGLVALSIPGLSLLYLGYVIGQTDGAASLKKDRRPHIVFLRSFHDDARYSFNDQGTAARFLGLRPFFEWLPPPFRYAFNLYPLRLLKVLVGRGRDTAEEQILGAVSKFGPMIAIGRPNERFSTPGVPRIYVSHDAWQAEVTALIDAAPMIILQPAPTEGVWWEVETAFRRVPGHRVLTCLAAAQTPDELDITRTRLNQHLPRPIHGLRPGHVFVWVDRDGEPHAEYLRSYSPFTWPLRATSADLRRTLGRFFASWKEEPALARACPPLDRPPRRRGLAAAAAVLLFLGVQVGAGLAYNVATVTVLAPSPASLVRAQTVPVDGDGFSLNLNAAWKPCRAPYSVFGKTLGFEIRPNYACLIETQTGLFRMKLDGPDGPAEALRELGRSLAEKGRIDNPEAAAFRVETFGDREWTHASYKGKLWWRPIQYEFWVSRSPRFDYLVQFIRQGSAPDDDPIARTVRDALGSFQTKDPELHFLAGDEALKAKNYDRAIAELSEAVRLDPQYEQAAAALADACLAKGDRDGALTALDKLINLNAKNIQAHRIRGSIWSEKNDPDRAIIDYTAAIDLAQDQAAGAAGYLRALVLDPRLYVQRGDLWYGKKKYDQAIADYTAAIELGPSVPSSYIKRGNARDDNHQFPEALADYTAAIALDPGSASAYLERGIAWAGQKAYGKAIADYGQVLRLAPENSRALNSLAWIWATCPVAAYRNGEAAVEAAHRACQLTDGKNARMLGTLAAAYAELGKFDDAVQTQQRAVSSSRPKTRRRASPDSRCTSVGSPAATDRRLRHDDRRTDRAESGICRVGIPFFGPGLG